MADYDYVPDPSYNPDTPVVATYPTNNGILYTDPTTGALVFPTEIKTSTFSSATQNTINTQSSTNLTNTTDPANNIILTGKSSSGVSLDYTNLLTTLGTFLKKSEASNTYQKLSDMSTYINNISVEYDPALNISIMIVGNYLVVDYTNLLNNLALRAPLNSPTFTGTVSGITAAMVGLGNVNNTSDANKPISTATQAALNLLATNLAPLASPTFTGTVSGPTPTTSDNSTTLATTAYVKSNLATYVDLASFQTIAANKLFNRGLSIAYNTGDGAVKVLPNSTNTSASSISFFRYYAQTTTNAGDVWVMGQNAFSAGAGNFAIGNNSVTALTINSNGSITANSGSITVPNGSITANGATFTGTAIAPTQIATDNSTNIATTAYVQSNLSIYQTIANMASYLLSATATTTYQTIAGMSSYLTTAAASTTYQPKAWISANINADGTVASTGGTCVLTNASVSKTGTGTYIITYGQTAPTTPSACFVQMRNSTGFMNYSGLSATQVTVQTYNTATTPVLNDKQFTVLVFV